ncbi:hypothetical protein [Azospirillum sp. sgz301742]
MARQTRREWILERGWDPRDPDAIVEFVLAKAETEEDKKAVEVEARIVAALLGAEPWPK